MPILIDSYSESNYDTNYYNIRLHPSADAYRCCGGQSFQNLNGVYKITSAKFYLKRTGAVSGNAHAVSYSHSGTFGSSSVPNVELARSDDFDVSTLSDVSFELKEFTFSGAQQYQMQPLTYYVIAFEDPTSGDAQQLDVGVDGSSPSHAGNYMKHTSAGWAAESAKDLCFYVYGEEVGGGLSIPVAMHHYNQMKRALNPPKIQFPKLTPLRI